MAEIIIPATVGLATAGVAAWQANHARRKDKMESAKDLKTIHKNLINITGLLYAIRDDYEAALREKETKKKATEKYDDWSDKVSNLKKEVDELNSKYKKRNLLSKRDIDMEIRMKKKSSDANRLCELGAGLEDIFVSRVIKMDAPDIKDLPTFRGHLKEIMDLVANKNNEVKCVALWGMPGVGKTSIMKNLNDDEEVLNSFDFVIWLEVSKKILGIDQLRQEIAGRLKLNLDGIEEHNVRDTIKEKLKGKRILLLLDDVKKVFKLDEIGIDLKDGKCSKIVLTTRTLNVCQPMVDVECKVKKLDMGEASKMFKGVMGKSKHIFEPRIDKVIDSIVKYLDCLPFLIEKIASSFKMKDTLDSWREGYTSLLVSDDAEDEDGMILLYNILNACFNELGETQKKCFFYIALYPEACDVHRDCLYDCWEAEDLYKSFTLVNSKSLRPNGVYVLKKLKEVSLLEQCSCNEYVRMHKWIRRAVLYRLAREVDQKHLIETGKSLQQHPTIEQWEGKAWISLADNDMKMLLGTPNCSMLSTLFLQKNPLLETISDLFFQDAKNLRVLNVDGTGIKSLPSSMSTLDNVRVLYLNGCSNLGEFPLQILKTVEVLDIRCSRIRIIPPEVVNLSKLRRFLVSFPNSVDDDDDHAVVLENCNVISTMCNIEELIIDVKSLKQFCTRMHHFVIVKVATSTLPLLTTFKFCFLGGVEDNVIQMVGCTPTFSVPTAKAFKGFLQRREVSKPEPFQVFIGDSSSLPQIPNFKSYERYLGYCNGKGSRNTIRVLLTKIDALEFRHLNKVSDFEIANLENVEGCLIENCDDVQAIANNVDSPILPNLKELYIKMMPKLKRILKGLVPPRSLYNLKMLKIEKSRLIKELLVDSRNATLHADFLPNLETLILIDLENLTSICPHNSLNWPALKKIRIDDCPNLIKLPFSRDNAEKLESIEAEMSWWDELEWQEEGVQGRLLPLLAPLGDE